jgi:hypothetical protein
MAEPATTLQVTDGKVQAIIGQSILLAKAYGVDAVDFMRQLLLLLRRWEGDNVSLLEDQAAWGAWKVILDKCLADKQWQDILDYPDTPLDQNYNLMAAEHYAFARYIARSYGDPNTEGTLNVYFHAKKFLMEIGGEKLLRTSAKHPVLKESQASLAWKSKGVADGLQDYAGAHGGKLGVRNSSRGMLKANILQQYQTVRGNTGY